MTTPSNAHPAAEISPARRLYWSVRREIWENRSIYLAPTAVAAVVLIGFFVGVFSLPERMRAAMALSPIGERQAIQQPYLIAAMMLMATQLLVAVFYCLDALYGERRDRSILFWKSLPVSDRMTLVSKASIPMLVLPLVTFVLTMATHLVMMLVSSAVLAASGMSTAPLLTRVPFFETSAIHFVHLAGYHGISYAPLYGWLLLVSAWAKRAPILWAVLPPVAVGLLEKIALGTSHFTAMLQHHFLGSSGSSDGMMTLTMLAPPSAGHFFMEPGLWIGLAVTALFLFAAMRLHRSRGAL